MPGAQMILGGGKLAGRKEEEVKGVAAVDRQKTVCKCRQVPLFLGGESFEPALCMDRLWALCLWSQAAGVN